MAFPGGDIPSDLGWRSAFQILQVLIEEAIVAMKRTKSKGRPSRGSTAKAPVGSPRKRPSARAGTAPADKTGRRSASRSSAKTRARRGPAETAGPTERRRRSAMTEVVGPAPLERSKVRPTPAEIAQRAYHLYLERGRIEGSPDADWFAAEMELWAEHSASH
jgi:hypothetical protein